MNIPETWDPTNITTPKIRIQHGYSDLSSWHTDPSEATHILASECPSERNPPRKIDKTMHMQKWYVPKARPTHSPRPSMNKIHVLCYAQLSVYISDSTKSSRELRLATFAHLWDLKKDVQNYNIS